MSAIYELIENRGITPKTSEAVLGSWNRTQLRDFVQEAHALLKAAEPEQSESPYRFLANAELSGGPSPCSRLRCRLAHVDRLARFAALYGDFVALQEPFPYARALPTKTDDLRARLRDDIAILHYAKPLVDAGLADFTSRSLSFCEDHLPEVVRSGGTKRAYSALRKEFGSSIALVQELNKSVQVIRIEGPEDLIEHGIQFFHRHKETPISVARPDRFGRRRLVGKSRREIVDRVIRPVIADIIQADLHSRAWKLNYLTNRPADFTALGAATTPSTAEFNRAIVDGLSHALPFLENVQIADLISFRRSEGEAFQVYRDEVSTLLRQLSPKDAPKVRQAFHDVIEPQLNRIDRAVDVCRRTARREVGTNVAIGSGLVAIGLTTGLLPNDLGQFVAALGGFDAGAKALRAASALVQEPSVAKEDKFYFLWKVRQHASRNTA